MTQVNKNGKQVIILARIVFKSDNRKVCYISRSSQSDEQYTTCLFAGRVCSCTCKGYQRYHKCYHATQIQQKEAERQQFQVEAIEKANAREAALVDAPKAVTLVSPVGTSQVIPMMPVAKSHTFAEMKAKYDVRNTTSKQRQEAPLQRQGFSLMR